MMKNARFYLRSVALGGFIMSLIVLIFPEQGAWQATNRATDAMIASVVVFMASFLFKGRGHG